jgi:hypothetical protein
VFTPALSVHRYPPAVWNEDEVEDDDVEWEEEAYEDEDPELADEQREQHTAEQVRMGGLSGAEGRDVLMEPYDGTTESLRTCRHGR